MISIMDDLFSAFLLLSPRFSWDFPRVPLGEFWYRGHGTPEVGREAEAWGLDKELRGA